MTYRIDIALQPGILIAVATILVLLNLLLGAVLYPYFRDRMTDVEENRMGPFLEESEETERDLEERIDDFIEHAHEDRIEPKPQ